MRIDKATGINAALTGSFSGSFIGVGNFTGLEADSVAWANITSKPADIVSGSDQIATAFAQTILDDADAAAVRTTIGVDAAGTDNSTDVTLGGTPDYITIDGQVITRNQIDLTTDVTGILPVGNMAATALTTIQTAANESAHLALTAEEGDVVVRSDENKTYMHNGGTAGTMADYTLLATPTDAVTSVNGNTGVVTVLEATFGNVSASGALMDSEVTNLDQVKTFDSSDYASATTMTQATGSINVNESNIATNLTKITVATGSINVNESNIATNVTNIATNLSKITVATGSINVNETAIAALNAKTLVSSSLQLASDISGSITATSASFANTINDITVTGALHAVSASYAISSSHSEVADAVTFNNGLTTDADTQFDSIGIGTAASGTTGEIRATGDITAFYSSDERLKENFKNLDGALDKVNKIGGYEFDWKDGIEDVVSKKGHDIGVKAQELQAQYPELVHERDNGFLAVDYVKLNAVLIEAVKELTARVVELEKRS